MIENSQDISKLSAALHAAQGAVGGVKRDATNPHFKNRYATLEAVIDAARPALQANGLAFTQAPGALVDGAVEITTMLMHESGQWLRSTLHVPLGKRDPQGVGSAITYGCRYALMATLGLPPTDDDAEGTVDRSPPRQEPRQEAQPRPRAATPVDGLLAAVRNAKTVVALDNVVNDPNNIRLYKGASETDQARISDAVQLKRDDFSAGNLRAG